MAVSHLDIFSFQKTGGGRLLEGGTLIRNNTVYI